MEKGAYAVRLTYREGEDDEHTVIEFPIEENEKAQKMYDEMVEKNYGFAQLKLLYKSNEGFA